MLLILVLMLKQIFFRMMDLTHALSHLASFYIIGLCVLGILASKNLFLVLVYFLLCLKSENRTFSIFIF
jgi:hypothetical protein